MSKGKRSQINARLELDETREAARAEIAELIRRMTTEEAARVLGISNRQLCRIRKRYQIFDTDLRKAT